MYDQQSLRSACAYAQSDLRLCESLEYSMTLKLLTEHHLEFLSLKGGCRGSPESPLVKMPHCWKSHVVAHFTYSLNLDPREVMVQYSSLTGTTVTAIREKCLSDVEDFDPDMVILQLGLMI